MPSYTTTHTSRRMHPKAQAEYLQAWKEYNKQSEKEPVSELANTAPAVQSSASKVSAQHEAKSSASAHIPRRMHPKAQEEYLAAWAEYNKQTEDESKSSATTQSSSTNMYAMPIGGEKRFLGMSYMMDKHRPLPAAHIVASNKASQEWKSKVVVTPPSSRASSVSTASTSPPPVPVTAEAAKTEATVKTPVIVQSARTPSPAPQTSAPRQRLARQSRPRNQVSRQAPSRTSTAARPREELPAGNAWGNFATVVKQDDDAHVAKAHANKEKSACHLAELTAVYKNKEGKSDTAKFEKVASDKVVGNKVESTPRTSTAAPRREVLPATSAWGNFATVVKQDDDAHVVKAHANKAKYAGQLAEFTTMYRDKKGKTAVAKFERVVGDKVETE